MEVQFETGTGISIWCPCNPPTTTAQMRRHTATGATYRTDAQKAAIASIGEVLKPHQPAKPLLGPISLTIELTWPWRRSERKGVVAHGRVWHDSKPDLDNVVKEIQDQLASWRFIEKDQQVAELIVRKFWSGEPGIRILLKPLGVAAGG